MTLVLVGCGAPCEGLWEEAIYTSDTSLGEGDTTFYLDVVAGDKRISLTVSTDEKNLGTALSELGIVEGEAGPFGLYIKRVNGILADYDTDGSWWGLTVNGESSPVGADGVEIVDGDRYELVYSR